MPQPDKQTSRKSLLMLCQIGSERKLIFHRLPFLLLIHFQRGSDELLSQAAVMAPASDNNNQDLASKKAKLEPGTVLGGVGKYPLYSCYAAVLYGGGGVIGDLKSSLQFTATSFLRSFGTRAPNTAESELCHVPPRE